MNGSIAERDWKCMKKLKDELLSKLCARINKGCTHILNDTNDSQHQKYQKLYKHIEESDNIVAECFDGWSRSKLTLNLFALQRHDLLTDQQIQQLSDETQQRLKAVKEL